MMLRGLGIAIAVCLTVSVGAAVALTILPIPAPGHRPLHIGCSNHNHGPERTAGEGKRLLEARSIARQARPPTE